VELGLADEKTLFRVASGALVISGLIGLYLTLTSGLGVIAFGLAGAFLAYFYTAPPLRLAARKGLGELSVGLAFGPLATAGTVYALTGLAPLSSFLIGIPIGLFTVLILWINQFPDEEADKATGKNNMVVVLGKENARWGYLFLVLVAFGLVIYLVMTGHFPPLTLITLLLIPFAVFACAIVFRNYAQRSLIRANVATIQLHALAGVMMAVSIFVTGVFFST
jgi:1,4-dihydroxy-2-naphthoate octaprenyltransferase